MSRVVLGIDPGPVNTAWLILADGAPRAFAIWPNEIVLDSLRSGFEDVDDVAIEKVESFGMSVGAEVFETVFWTGRFVQALLEGRRGRETPVVTRIGRLKVKTTLCHDSRAKDSNIRQALIDRFGGSDAIGRKGSEGPLYGISKDVWSALAIAVTHVDQEGIASSWHGGRK